MTAVQPYKVAPSPTVLIAAVPRERFSRTNAALDPLCRTVGHPVEVICVDGGSPPRTARWLAAAARERAVPAAAVEKSLRT